MLNTHLKVALFWCEGQFYWCTPVFELSESAILLVLCGFYDVYNTVQLNCSKRSTV